MKGIVTDTVKKYSVMTKPYIITIVTIFVMSEIISVLCMREFLSGIWFTLFQVIGVLIPGTACLLGCGWPNGLDWKACGFSYVIGYCFSLFVYFALMLCGLQLYVRYVITAIFIISCIVIFLNKRSLRPAINDATSGQKLILISVWSMFFVAFFASCCSQLLPPVVATSAPINDMLYWVGNIIELTMEFPPKDFRNYPATYSYHYFSSAQLALASLYTSIRPIHIGLFFSVVQSVFLRVFSGYLVLTKCTESTKMQIVGMILLFFSSGYESKVVLTYLSHSYFCPFGMEYGLAIYLIFIYLLLLKYNERVNQLKTSALIWIGIFILLGEKSSYGGIGLLGLGVICIGFLIRKEYRKAIITGIPACCIFAVEYFYMINLTRYLNNPASAFGGNSFIPIWETESVKIVVQYINRFLEFLPLPATPVLFVTFIFLGSPVCFFATMYNSWRISKCAYWNIMDVSFLSMYFAGYLIWIFVQIYGTGNMYFAFSSFPAAIIWLIKCELPWSKMGKIAFAFSAFLSIAGFVNGYGFRGGDFDLIRYISCGVSTMTSGNVSPYLDWSTYVDMEEYEAYEWIRANTKQDSIIATNRLSPSVGAFTERHINHPKMGNSVYTKTTDEERKQALSEYKEKGIKYIIFEAKYGDQVEYLAKECDIVYQSENIIIYSVPL